MTFLIDVLEILMKKICNMCKVEKDITEFRKSGKYYRSECKECSKILFKDWYERTKVDRKEHVSKVHKEYYKKNKEIILTYQKKYRENNKDKIKAYKKVYYQNNKEYVDNKNKDNYVKYKEYYRNYYKNNKEKIKQYISSKLKDNKYRMKKQVRNMLYDSFKRKNKIKKESAEQLLGCDLDFFISYLLETYKKNYGVDYDNKEKVHIDHIIPLATAETEEDVIKLCHYTNLQLLKAKDNLKKGAKKEKMQKIESEVK